MKVVLFDKKTPFFQGFAHMAEKKIDWINPIVLLRASNHQTVIKKKVSVPMFKAIFTALTGVAVSVFLTFHPVSADEKAVSIAPSLEQQMTELDSLFFERGFNQCDLDYVAKVSRDDLSFYHDQGGFQDKQAFLEAMRVNVCGDRQRRPIRRLREGTLKVFPLHNDGVLYGAIVEGAHDFFIEEDGKPEIATSSAKFTSVWRKDDGKWMLAEVLSYDHHGPDIKASELSPLDQTLRDNHIPLLGLATLEKGHIQQLSIHGQGAATAADGVESVFRVASLTKPVFALAVLKLVDAGLLSLDEPLSSYWVDPDLAGDERVHQLTARLVLSHQTGFPNWRYMTKDKHLRFEHDPGTRYQYSGEGFEYLRKAIEAKLGTDIESLIHDYVFEPAGMTRSAMSFSDQEGSLHPVPVFDGAGNELPVLQDMPVNVAASLVTTIADYSHFLGWLMKGADLSPALQADMFKEQVKIDQDNYFTLGWQKFTSFSDDEFALVHSGSDPGIKSLAVLFPKSGNGYVIFMNGDEALPVYKELLETGLYKGKELWHRQ